MTGTRFAEVEASRIAGLRYLDGLAGYERTGTLQAPTTERMVALVAELGNPQRSYRVIHVTGTNGKGSTAAMTAALLRGQGLRAGSYTSPHVEHLTERVAVDGVPVGADELGEALLRVAEAAERTGVTPSWFEAFTAAGLWLLAEREVDVAVVEVGMLGRWDATNVVDGAVAIITNVQLDHTDLAGPTRAHIATEKAGIVDAGATLVLGESDPALRPIFLARDPGRVITDGDQMFWRHRRPVSGGSVVDLVTPWGMHEDVAVGMVGAHQCSNALHALTAVEAFLRHALPAGEVSTALADTRVAGRMELLTEHPFVVLDGAHNPAAARALRRGVDEVYGAASRRVLLVGALAGRDPVEFLDSLGVRSATLLITTEPDSPRAMSASAVADAARAFGVPTTAIADPAAALATATAAAGHDGVVVATGSLYLVAALRVAARQDGWGSTP